MTESKSNLLGKSASTYLILLLKLIEKGDWYRFSQLALDEPQAFQSLSNLVSRSSGFNGMSLLHAAARYNPPSNIISKMIELCPDTIEKVDCLNRTALHVAAGTGADVSVIRVLTSRYPEACMIQDVDGRLPLHLACDSSCQLFEGSQNSKLPNFAVIQVLLSVSMESSVAEDEEGMSAVEYAIISDADISVVKLLQRATQREVRKLDAAVKKLHSVARDNSVEGFLPRGLLGAPSA
ncbi:predicted protein [Thalassiosira pseudonana CCMP1335]|uniref:Uncharacterized protein n=1 Tax=Thalassiosira pseudonana TaxID=35128 RepID=B8BX77_THAPS|nr:predicted protein [Thalassiosira pseudonana CCMP1335]EED94158.1 predicted protein [Thalassiosira pseudonana CCMP1335]|eukprot:scaffold3626_cov189-Alexandrium_tamarense.AAC.8